MKNTYKLFILSTLLLVSNLGFGQTLDPYNTETGVSLQKVLQVSYSGTATYSNTFGGPAITVHNNTTGLNIFSLLIFAGTAYPSGGGSVNIEGGNLLISGLNLVEENSYSVTVAPNAIEVDGIPHAGISDWSFTTGAAPTPPTIINNGYSPSINELNVDLNQTLTLTFDQNIQFGANGLTIRIKRSSNNSIFQTFYIDSDVPSPYLSIAGTTLSITHNQFEQGTQYYITIASGAIQSTSDIDFNGFSTSTDWYFTTVYSAPITTITPTNGATNIDITAQIIVDFDVPAQKTDGTELTDANLSDIITFTQGSSPIPYTATINGTKDQIIITPVSDLTQETIYYLDIATIESISGNVEQSSSATSTFTTEIIRYWTGLGETNNISDNANWNIDLPTGSSFSAIIQPATYMPIVTGTATLNKLTIEAGASVEISSTGNITINNLLELNSSNETIGNGILLNKGILNTSQAQVIIHQHISSEPYDYYISSPVTNATPENVGVNGEAFRFIPDKKWEVMNPTDTFNPAEGYVVWSTNDTDLQFKGNINNASSYTFNCYRATSPYNNYGWNLIGNPYPCAIDLNSLDISDNMNYHFQLRLNNTGQLGIINESGHINLSDQNTTFLPSMHAVWVQVSIDQTQGSIVIPNTARRNYNYSYLKSTESPTPSIKLAGINSDGIKDETLIAFNPDAVEREGNFDSEKLFIDHNQSILELYSVKNNTQLAINTIPEDIQEQTIDLGFYAPKDGTYNINLVKLNNIPDAGISIEDKANSTVTKLNTGDSYSFTTEKGNNDTRFVLHINSTSTSVQNPQSEQINIYNLKNEVYIEVPELINPTVEIYDTTGKLLTNKPLIPNSVNQLSIQYEGIAILKVISKEKVFSQKLLIK